MVRITASAFYFKTSSQFSAVKSRSGWDYTAVDNDCTCKVDVIESQSFYDWHPLHTLIPPLVDNGLTMYRLIFKYEHLNSILTNTRRLGNRSQP